MQSVKENEDELIKEMIIVHLIRLLTMIDND